MNMKINYRADPILWSWMFWPLDIPAGPTWDFPTME